MKASAAPGASTTSGTGGRAAGSARADAAAAAPVFVPAPLARAALVLRDLVRRLPAEPPSFVVARVLDRVLLPRLPADAREALARRAVEVEVVDFGLRVKLRLDARGFALARRAEPVALAVRARSDALWRLVRGEDDADRLFFERALVMEGDTEYGLVLKNTLDAIGPLWR